MENIQKINRYIKNKKNNNFYEENPMNWLEGRQVPEAIKRIKLRQANPKKLKHLNTLFGEKEPKTTCQEVRLRQVSGQINKDSIEVEPLRGGNIEVFLRELLSSQSMIITLDERNS